MTQETSKPKRPDYLRAALLRALEGMLHDGRRAIKPHHIVFQALENAMETLRKLPDREAAWLRSGGAWPAIIATGAGYAKADMETGLALILSSILGEDEEEDAPRRKDPAMRGEIDEMNAVFESFRISLAGTRRRRDWKILCLSAAGKSQKFVARAAGASLETVRQEKLAQSLAIAKALEAYMPRQLEGGGYGLVA
jgi:hypothetical protein